MTPEESALGSLSDIELRDHIKQLELQIAGSEAILAADASETNSSRRLA